MRRVFTCLTSDRQRVLSSQADPDCPLGGFVVATLCPAPPPPAFLKTMEHEEEDESSGDARSRDSYGDPYEQCQRHQPKPEGRPTDYGHDYGDLEEDVLGKNVQVWPIARRSILLMHARTVGCNEWAGGGGRE